MMRFLFSGLKFSFFIFFTVLCVPSAYAQINTSYYKVLSVSVEGNVTADANTIIEYSGLKKIKDTGREIQIPGDETISAVKNLWDLRIFSDIQLIIEKYFENGVFLKIKVSEYPRFEQLVLQGNSELSKSELEEMISLVRGQILKPQELIRIKNKIVDAYTKEGYLNTKVDVIYYDFLSIDSLSNKLTVTWRNQKDFSDEITTTYDDLQGVNRNLSDKIKVRKLVKFKIEENSRLSVRKIHFTGNSFYSEDDLKSELEELSEKTWWKFWSSARYEPEKVKKDKETLLKFLNKNGFRDAEILSDSLVYTDDKSMVDVYFNILEGSRYKLRNIVWEGNTVYNSEVLNERLGFKSGDIYDLISFNQNLRGNEKQNDVASLYLDNGYLTFTVNAVEKKVSKDSLDVFISVNENNQFKIGKVSIKGNDKTKEKVIRRELYTVPSDFFNKAAMIRSLQQLANLQYFNVEKLYKEGVDYNLENDSTVNVAFIVEEKSSDYLNASIGYSGSFGFSGAIGVTLNNFSIAEPFQLGAGQILSFNWQFGVGNLYRTFSFGFTEPWFMNSPTLVGFDLFSTRQSYIYDLFQAGGSVKVGRRLKWPDDYFYIQGFFRYQNNNVLNGGGFYREGESEQFTLGFTLNRKDVDNPIFPSKGSSLTWSSEISGGPFLPGTVDYFKMTLTTEWYKRLFNSNRFALYLSSDMGYIEELKKNTTIQPFELFYMGGAGLVIATTSLRGYDDRTVGPKQASGDVIGGRMFFKYIAELRFAVSLDPMPLYILAFAEAGNVFENITTADPFKLRRSAGFGARILINPVGLLGFDLGYGFDRREVDGTDPKWQFHFQFGKGF